jgi:hypothetical protein
VTPSPGRTPGVLQLVLGAVPIQKHGSLVTLQ